MAPLFFRLARTTTKHYRCGRSIVEPSQQPKESPNARRHNLPP
jgi:hypothetical protein